MIFFFLTPLLEAPKYELEFPLNKKPLSNLQRMTSNQGAKCPATLISTPEKCILEAIILDLDHVLKQTRDVVTNQADGGKAQNLIST